VRYSLVFEINSPKITSKAPEPAPSAPSGLWAVVTEALREEASLPIDLDSLTFQPGDELLLHSCFRVAF